MPENETVSEVTEVAEANSAAPVETKPSSDVIGQISKEDLKTLNEVQQTARDAKAIAEKAQLVAENATLKFENVLNKIYLKYSLKLDWVLETTTGDVRLKRPEDKNQ